MLKCKSFLHNSGISSPIQAIINVDTNLYLIWYYAVNLVACFGIYKEDWMLSSDDI